LWLCEGDVNEVICASEQFGDGDNDWELEMKAFRAAVDYCRMSSLPYPILGIIDYKAKVTSNLG
jgi:hypothetical protein